MSDTDDWARDLAEDLDAWSRYEWNIDPEGRIIALLKTEET